MGRQDAFPAEQPSAVDFDRGERIHFRGDRRTCRLIVVMIIQGTVFHGVADIRHTVLRCDGVSQHISELDRRIEMGEEDPP